MNRLLVTDLPKSGRWTVGRSHVNPATSRWTANFHISSEFTSVRSPLALIRLHRRSIQPTGKPRSRFSEAVAPYQDSIDKIAICFLNLSICILTSVDRFLISVFSASKKIYCFLKIRDRLLISVIHALILVFSASKKVYCFLKIPDRLLISVLRALVTIICL
jgi:hypothetical protein